MDTYNYLIDHEVKPSVHRIAVMDYLLTHCNHPTVDDIYNALFPQIPTLSKTTVYNTLKLLSEHNACLTLNIDEKNVRFDGNVKVHAHFKCKKCGKIIDVPIKVNRSIFVNKIDNLAVNEVQVYYYGICDACQKEKSENQ